MIDFTKCREIPNFYSGSEKKIIYLLLQSIYDCGSCFNPLLDDEDIEKDV